MYIYLFVILPIFYSIIIHLLFIFLIIYWLATVGDYCRRPRVGDLLSAQIAEITSSTAENTYSTTRVTYRDLLRQSKRSERLVGECRQVSATSSATWPTARKLVDTFIRQNTCIFTHARLYLDTITQTSTSKTDSNVSANL